MTAKAMALDAIQKLPDESTFDEIRERIEFIAGVRKGAGANRAWRGWKQLAPGLCKS